MSIKQVEGNISPFFLAPSASVRCGNLEMQNARSSICKPGQPTSPLPSSASHTLCHRTQSRQWPLATSPQRCSWFFMCFFSCSEYPSFKYLLVKYPFWRYVLCDAYTIYRQLSIFLSLLICNDPSEGKQEFSLDLLQYFAQWLAYNKSIRDIC